MTNNGFRWRMRMHGLVRGTPTYINTSELVGMTTVVSSSPYHPKRTARIPPPRPPPPRKASSEPSSEPLGLVPLKTDRSESAAAPSQPPLKPPRTHTSRLQQKSATLPSSLRGKGGVDMTEVLQRYASTSASDEDLDSLPSESGARPMDVVSDAVGSDAGRVADFTSNEEDSGASEGKERTRSVTSLKSEVPPRDSSTPEDREDGKGSAPELGRTQPPSRPPRPHITVYQKYITSSNRTRDEPQGKRRERKTVGHIYIPDSPPQSPPRPSTDLYKEYLDQGSNSKTEPVEVEVEIKNGSDEGSLSPSGACVGNTLMKRYQAPVAGEVMEETEEFEYPDWARSRTKVSKAARKTRKVESRSNEAPSQRKPTRLKSFFSLCSGRMTTEDDDCLNTEGVFDLSEMKSSPVDALVIQSVAYLNREKVLKEEGLFRIPGDVTEIQRLYGRFRSGHSVDLLCITDPATVSGLLKMYCRNKPDPLIPHGPLCISLAAASREHDLPGIKSVLEMLPDANYMTIQMVIELLHKVSEHSELNQMTSGALATSCGLSIFPAMQPCTSGQLLKYLIDHCTEVFQLPVAAQ